MATGFPGSLPLEAAAQQADSVRVVCTFLPVYVFTKNVVGSTPGVSVELLIGTDNGCPHNYALRPADVKRVASAQIIVANGLGMEPFLEELSGVNAKARVLTIADDCSTIVSQQPCDHDHGEDHHHHEIANGHVWASPKEAATQVRTLARKLAEADPARSEPYRTNAEHYAKRLMDLHERMQSAAKEFRVRKIVTSHDAFAYLARDLGLEVVNTLNAEPGREPSARQLMDLVKSIRDAKAAGVFYEPGSAEKLAHTVAREAGIRAFALNPFNTLNHEPSLDAYELVMTENMKTLTQALGGAP
jgi:ABC-type Zn uptake system ZnuABC Zn-binding protein ZnuA